MNLLVLHFKKLYTHTLFCGWGGASILNPENMSTKEKSPCQTVNIEKSLCQVNLCKKINSVPREGYKILRSQRVNTVKLVKALTDKFVDMYHY